MALKLNPQHQKVPGKCHRTLGLSRKDRTQDLPGLPLPPNEIDDHIAVLHCFPDRILVSRIPLLQQQRPIRVKHTAHLRTYSIVIRRSSNAGPFQTPLTSTYEADSSQPLLTPPLLQDKEVKVHVTHDIRL